MSLNECEECGEPLVHGDISEHRAFHRLENHIHFLMQQVEITAKKLAPLTQGDKFMLKSKGTGFSYTIRADPKAEMKEFLNMNPHLRNWKSQSPPTLYDDCVKGMFEMIQP